MHTDDADNADLRRFTQINILLTFKYIQISIHNIYVKIRVIRVIRVLQQ